VVKKPETTG